AKPSERKILRVVRQFDHEHVAGQRFQYALRGTANESPFQTAARDGPHDEDVRMPFSGHTRQVRALTPAMTNITPRLLSAQFCNSRQQCLGIDRLAEKTAVRDRRFDDSD